MNYFKKELGMEKFLKYCHIAMYGKSKRIRDKANKIVTYQVAEFMPYC